VQKTFDIDGPAQIEVRLASGEIVVDPTLEGHIEVHTAEGGEPRDSRINAESRVEKPVSAEQSNAFGPLYRKFADLTVDSLNSAYE